MAAQVRISFVNAGNTCCTPTDGDDDARVITRDTHGGDDGDRQSVGAPASKIQKWIEDNDDADLDGRPENHHSFVRV